VIPRDHVTAWREFAPWPSDHQVEQDLVISRAIAEMFSIPGMGDRLAFRGGTAIYKLYVVPAARYSEDIDLVQVRAEPIGRTLSLVREVLDSWLGQARRVFKEGRVNLVYRFHSEDSPPRKLRLKIEINSREHFTVMGLREMPFEVNSRWWSGAAGVTTFAPEELLGTKLRALFQRRKGRDLFDLWYVLEHLSVDPRQVVACFREYAGSLAPRLTARRLEEDLRAKLADPIFATDLGDLLRTGIDWDPERAARIVLDAFAPHLPP